MICHIRRRPWATPADVEHLIVALSDILDLPGNLFDLGRSGFDASKFLTARYPEAEVSAFLRDGSADPPT